MAIRFGSHRTGERPEVKDVLLYFAMVALNTAIFFPLHILASRVTQGAKLITTILATIAASTLAGTATGWLLFHGSFSSEGAEALACVASALTFFAYAGHYGLLGPISVDRSVSAHIVALLYLAPQQKMSEAGLGSLYTHTDMLEKRYNDCISTGLIERHGADLVLTPKGARIARFYLGLGEFLGMRQWYLKRHRQKASPDGG